MAAKPKTKPKPKSPRERKKAKDGSNRGRYLALTQAKIDKAAQAIEDGHYAQTAAKLAGMGVTSWYRYLEVGEADHEAGKTTTLPAKFWVAIETASAIAEENALAVIREAATTPIYGAAGNMTSTGAWQAAAWYLERRMPDKWGRRDKHEHSGSVTLTQLEALVDQGSE